jgi:ABC-type multidrug transport system fused ATPase/permease subunit
MKGHAVLYGLLGVVMVVASLLESLTLAAFFPVFQAVLTPTGPQPGGGLLGLMATLSRWMPFADPVCATAAILVLCMIAKEGVVLIREWVNALTSGRVLHDLQRSVMEKYAAAPYGTFLERKHADLLYDTVIGPHAVSQLLRRIPQFAAELLRAAAILVVLLAAFPWATLGLLAVVGGFAGSLQILSRTIAYRTGSGRVESHAEQTRLAHEFFSGIRHMMVFGVGERWVERFRRETKRHGRLLTKAMVWLAIPKSVVHVTAVSLLLGALVFFRVQAPDRFTSSLPMISLFGVALLQLLPSLVGLGRMSMEISEALPSGQRLHAALIEPLPTSPDGTRVFGGLREGIAFDRVSFGYPGRAILLRQISLVIRKGTMTAIVGPSGSGKTTILNLLLGLYEPGEGEILIEGIPLRQYRLETWRGAVGFVSQDPFICHATIADNILFGRMGCSREDVVRAARIANAHGFIAELPQGYDTVVGERGMKLSGGQQQRIAIARALLGDPEILIFDEATSHLDAVAEQQVQETIEQASKDRTVILVAHRPSAIRRADTILVLDQGRIVETGTHEELVSGQGCYAHLVASA